MIEKNMDLLRSIKDFCAEIGQNRLLVQGAGGNVSFKEGGILWVKASGTWIGEAKIKEIFTPVDLKQLQDAIQSRRYDISPIALGVDALKPSIETLLHALMPHKIVLHLHAIEALAYLVRKNARQQIGDVIGSSLPWKFIEYHKPGAELAGAIHDAICSSPSLNLLFLENHGVVIGCDSLEELRSTLSAVCSLLQKELSVIVDNAVIHRSMLDAQNISIEGYNISDDSELNELAINPTLLDMVKTSWALYPDHVVFLGSEPILVRAENINDLLVGSSLNSPYIFVEGLGVLESIAVTKGQKAQLRCYYDTLIRQPNPRNLSTLTKQQIYELLNWDAEKYRQLNA
ncbi:class II aldolase [Polynucleobacter sp. 73C-SIWE]|uniref:class II aldolase/adducin family protein n=1 Tax=Polynucleobacter sp. 73C-SIWE TaxID=2689098 RepID=UPI001C0DD546|nr:class II aldolase/adducin family protein [Polynucleobacter sp. 73C-SIWE]MBU3578651.1 class II aldolase [Polynucleobacter sp. 73C-SIWE]